MVVVTMMKMMDNHKGGDEDVCAQDRTHGKADTCNGDSGGPMTVQENFRSTLVGVTSRSLWRGCPNPYPHVYVRVTEERSWILRTAPGTQDSDCGTETVRCHEQDYTVMYTVPSFLFVKCV